MSIITCEKCGAKWDRPKCMHATGDYTHCPDCLAKQKKYGSSV